MSMQQVPSHRRVVVGVDTHKYVHVAVAIDELGTILDSRSFVADAGGYTQLIEWAAAFGGKLTFGIEGTGSYGAGLAGAVRRHGIGALEVMRTDRPPAARQVRHPGCRERRQSRPRRTCHRRAEVPRRCRGDDPSDQGRQGHRRQGQNRGDDQPQAGHRERPRRPPSGAAAPVADGADQPVREPATGQGHHHHRLPRNTRYERSPDAGSSSTPRSASTRSS